MLKQLITITIFLFIHDIQEIINYTYAIFDFFIFLQYLLYNNETFFNIKYALYRLNMRKIAFENY